MVSTANLHLYIAVAQDKGGGVSVRLHVGRSDIWDRRKGNSKQSVGNDFSNDRPRLILGHFELKLKGAHLTKGAMRLHLHTARVTAELSMDDGAGTVKIAAYAHAAKQALVVRRCRLNTSG